MANYTINPNTSLTINVNDVINNGSNGAWKIVGNSLIHDNYRESYIEKQYNFLTIGKKYRLTYTANRTSGNFRIYLGDTAGVLRNTSGTFTEEIIFTSGQPKIRFWASCIVTISSIKIDELEVVTEDELIDPAELENKSFTLSYYPAAQQFVSFHSYLPNNYIIHPNSLLAKRNNTQIKQLNKGDYGDYFDVDIKPFIIESIFNEAPLSTKIFDNITFNLKSELNGVSTNKFFDKMILNTEYQCSGEFTLNLANLTKKERNWCINKFNDITNNTNNTLFSDNWEDIKDQYPIDKVVNIDKIDVLKPWYQRGRFRDKFLCVRFIENNLEKQKIMCNFVSTIFRASQR